jgi:transcriptional regulator with XRE-family HTH domain
MHNLPSKLRTLREIHGFKQDFVGKYLGISQTGYSKIEIGEVDITIRNLQKIAQLYNTTPEQILIWDGQLAFNKVVSNMQLDKRLQTVEDKLATIIGILENK